MVDIYPRLAQELIVFQPLIPLSSAGLNLPHWDTQNLPRTLGVNNPKLWQLLPTL